MEESENSNNKNENNNNEENNGSKNDENKNTNEINNNEENSESKNNDNKILDIKDVKSGDINNLENDEYDYNEYNYDEEEDNVEKGQEEILETMFLEAKNSKNENKINLYLDIISLDESKEKIWSYKCYQEICLIYLQFEDHYMFPLYYKQLMDTARKIEYKRLSIYVDSTVKAFLDEIKNHCKESISHWFEDFSIDFNRKQQDKIINMFEAKFNLNFLLLSKEMSNQNKESDNDDSANQSENKFFELNIIDYLNDKDKLEQLTYDYLIKECKCDEKYLDKKGNTFFYYSPDNSKRGGETYRVPLGWIAFGLEVINKYNDNLDWLGNDGNPSEWAVAYHGFGARMNSQQIKDIIKVIVHDNLKPGAGQAYCGVDDRRHPGKKCGKGVYVTPKLDYASQYAGGIELGDKFYRLVIMVRVNPKYIREPTSMIDYWIVDGDKNQLRPYRLLLRESSRIPIRYR